MNYTAAPATPTAAQSERRKEILNDVLLFTAAAAATVATIASSATRAEMEKKTCTSIILIATLASCSAIEWNSPPNSATATLLTTSTLFLWGALVAYMPRLKPARSAVALICLVTSAGRILPYPLGAVVAICVLVGLLEVQSWLLGWIVGAERVDARYRMGPENGNGIVNIAVDWARERRKRGPDFAWRRDVAKVARTLLAAEVGVLLFAFFVHSSASGDTGLFQRFATRAVVVHWGYMVGKYWFVRAHKGVFFLLWLCAHLCCGVYACQTTGIDAGFLLACAVQHIFSSWCGRKQEV